MNRRVRVLIAKPGLDGHDRGAKVIALALRDAGYEVIYTGLHRTIAQIVESAIQEDVDVIGLSILSGAHIPHSESLLSQLHAAGSHPHVIVGGNIPGKDVEKLRSLGVSGVFPTGSRFEDVVDFIQQAVEAEAK